MAVTRPPDEPSEIARQALELRRLRGMTQADLSRLTGVAKSDISRFECGRAAPTTRTMDRLARALGARLVLVSEDELMGGQRDSSRDLSGSLIPRQRSVRT
jgi:transcriptional regulator with XRE-family HTH domain